MSTGCHLVIMLALHLVANQCPIVEGEEIDKYDAEQWFNDANKWDFTAVKPQDDEDEDLIFLQECQPGYLVFSPAWCQDHPGRPVVAKSVANCHDQCNAEDETNDCVGFLFGDLGRHNRNNVCYCELLRSACAVVVPDVSSKVNATFARHGLWIRVRKSQFDKIKCPERTYSTPTYEPPPPEQRMDHFEDEGYCNSFSEAACQAEMESDDPLCYWAASKCERIDYSNPAIYELGSDELNGTSSQS